MHTQSIAFKIGFVQLIVMQKSCNPVDLNPIIIEFYEQ